MGQNVLRNIRQLRPPDRQSRLRVFKRKQDWIGLKPDRQKESAASDRSMRPAFCLKKAQMLLLERQDADGTLETFKKR
jgi:hypothetical protein